MTAAYWSRAWKCECGSEDFSFDRSLCACGMMHNYCCGCGEQVDPCWSEPGPPRGSDEYLAALERRIAEQRKEIRHLRERLNDEGEGKHKANKHARRRIAALERIIGQQAVALDRQYHGLRALKDDA